MNRAERSLRGWGVAYPLTNAFFWAPVFFLYFNSRFPIEQVLQLEAIYYAAVVVLEVPSGYVSDRFGRVWTLRASAVAAVAAPLLFLFGEDFLGFALAQITLATHFALLSGTAQAFHADTLDGMGRSGEFPERESRLSRRAFLVKAAAALVGGAVGIVDLRIAYGLSALAALALLGTLFLLDEPPRARGQEWHAIGAQLRRAIARLRTPLLGWVFAYVLLQTTLEHIPYEFTQPWLAAALGEDVADVQRTPLVAGVVVAAVAAVGAMAAGWSSAAMERFGVVGTLLGVTALQTALIGAMAAWIHPALALLLLLRSVQPAVGHVVVAAAITPRVPQGERATYLSLHSLAGRLGYSTVLLGLAGLAVGGGVDEIASMQRMLMGAGVLAAVGLLALAVTRPRTVRPS